VKKTIKVEICDTTMRDGTQGMGVSLSTPAKLRLLRRLDDIGMDFVEGGFPSAALKDAEFFREAAKMRLAHARLVAFGSTRLVGIPAAHDHHLIKLADAGAEVVSVVGKTWSLHVRDVLRTTRDENLAMISDTVRFLKNRGKVVLFDAEHFYDGWKDSPAFTMEAVKAAVEAGCDCVVLCDTNGGCVPHEIYAITKDVVSALQVRVGVHTHNDTGMAAANSIEAVRAGARHVQGTINGYGERCGNADLCTVIPTLELKMDMTCVGRANLKELRGVSVFVDELTNMRRDERLPYVGKCAFAHKAGLHVNAVEKNPRAVEHITPALVGNERSVLLSDASGKSSVLMKAIEMGVMGLKKSSTELPAVVSALKDLEGKGYAFEAADASFRILVQKILKKHRPFFELEGFRVIVEKRGRDEPCLSEATIKVRVKDEIAHTVGEGNGPVDALDSALRKALTKFYPAIAKVLLTDFQVRILDPEVATGAKTRVLIESGDGQETWGTVGVSPNIIEASWEALVDSVEYKLFKDEEKAGRKRRKHD